MHRGAKHGEDSGTKPKFIDRDNRLYSRLVIVGISVSKDSESLARNLEPTDHRDMEGVEFDLTLESRGQCLDYTRPQHRLGTSHHYTRPYGDDQQRGQRDSYDPTYAGTLRLIVIVRRGIGLAL